MIIAPAASPSSVAPPGDGSIGADVPEDRRVYRCEVEISDLSSGVSRKVPLSFHHVIALVPRSRRPRRARAASAPTPASEQPTEERPCPPPKELMRFVDGSFVLDASSWEEFRARLRERYPDERYERRLHIQRDREAEWRREAAITALIQLVAEAAVNEVLKEVAQSPALGGEASGR